MDVVDSGSRKEGSEAMRPVWERAALKKLLSWVGSYQRSPQVLPINALSLLCILWPTLLGSLCLLLWFWSFICSSQQTLLSSDFWSCGAFYGDYAVLQLRLLNFSPFWSLIFTNHGTITLFYIAQLESWPRGLLAAQGKIKREINILEVKTVSSKARHSAAINQCSRIHYRKAYVHLVAGLKRIQVIKLQQQDGQEWLDHLLHPSGLGHQATLSALCRGQ